MTSRHQLVLLAGMAAALEGMLDAMRGAKRRVWIETYILRDDRLGLRLVEVLAPLAAKGIDVRLLFDDLGSKNTPPAFIEHVRTLGIRAQAYRKRRRIPAAIFPRNHSRIVLVDDMAFTGGSAWGDEWLPEAEGGEGWFDVCLGLRGPAVADFEHIFRGHWAERDVDTPPSDATSRWDHADLTVVSDLAGGWASVLDEHIAIIGRARTRVWLHNSYYFPPLRLRRAVADAARRGVDVKLVVPRATDLPPVHWAARGEYLRWMHDGVSVHEYQRTVTHAKYSVVDDDFCSVGSFNMNPTSIACANELEVFVRDRAFVARAAAQFQRDLAESVVLEAHAVERWAATSRFGYRVSAWLLRLLEKLLDRRWPPLLWADPVTPSLRAPSGTTDRTLPRGSRAASTGPARTGSM
jgi:cardiolipin synthase A/B